MFGRRGQLAEGEVRILDVDKMLAELRLEREQIEEAIVTLERLARGRGRRRGRPPSWLKDSASIPEGNGEGGNTLTFTSEPRRRGRPPGSSNKIKTPLAQVAEA